MELSLATVEQIVEELTKRSLEFALIVTPQEENDHAAETQLHVHSSIAESPEDNSLQESVYCLMAAISLLRRLATSLDDMENEKAEDLWRWQAVGETLLRDIFTTAEEWEQEEFEEEE